MRSTFCLSPAKSPTSLDSLFHQSQYKHHMLALFAVVVTVFSSLTSKEPKLVEASLPPFLLYEIGKYKPEMNIQRHRIFPYPKRYEQIRRFEQRSFVGKLEVTNILQTSREGLKAPRLVYVVSDRKRSSFYVLCSTVKMVWYSIEKVVLP